MFIVDSDILTADTDILTSIACILTAATGILSLLVNLPELLVWFYGFMVSKMAKNLMEWIYSEADDFRLTEFFRFAELTLKR